MLESLINPLYLPYIAYLQYVPTYAVPLPHLRQTKHTIKGTRKIDYVKCLSEKMLRKDAISAFLRHFFESLPAKLCRITSILAVSQIITCLIPRLSENPTFNDLRLAFPLRALP